MTTVRWSDLLLSAQHYRVNAVHLLLLNSFSCYSSRYFFFWSLLIAKQFLLFTNSKWIVRKLTCHFINIAFRGKLTAHQTIAAHRAKTNRFSWRVYFLLSLTLSCRIFDDARFSLHFFSDPKWAIDNPIGALAMTRQATWHHDTSPWNVIRTNKMFALKLFTLSRKT